MRAEGATPRPQGPPRDGQHRAHAPPAAPSVPAVGRARRRVDARSPERWSSVAGSRRYATSTCVKRNEAGPEARLVSSGFGWRAGRDYQVPAVSPASTLQPPFGVPALTSQVRSEVPSSFLVIVNVFLES